MPLPAAQEGIFTGGQMTDLPVYPGGIDPTALAELVSPGNASLGINYAISMVNLAALLNGSQYAAPTIITSGTTYNSVATDTRILVNKTIGSATSIVLLGSASYFQPVLVKDLKGDSVADPITVTFSGGQTVDGLSSVVIAAGYGAWWFNPLVSGGWYLTAA